MLPELERLIQLQETETRAATARRFVADAPSRIAALDAKLAAAREAVAAARRAVEDNHGLRRSLEKDQLALQQRLSKSKDQLMEVKTNTEYHAMQTQIAATSSELGRVEEQLLVRMVEADDLAARLKGAESALQADEAAVAAERQAIERDTREMEAALTASAEQRAQLARELPPATLEMFDRVLKARQGIAVAEAADGHCTVCHVRLRPQVYNTIRRNDAIIQCDSCQRILYFSGVHERSAAGHAAANRPSIQEGDDGPAADTTR